MTVKPTRGAWLVLLLLLFAYAYFYQDPGYNGNSRLGLTFALVQEGRLTIDSFHDRAGTETGDKSFYNGHYYTDKAIGSSLVAAVFYLPVYWLERLSGWEPGTGTVKYLLTLLAIGLPAALAGSLMYRLCAWITGSPFRAFVITLAIMLGTMLFPFGEVFFGHTLAAALLFIAFFLAFQLKAGPGPATAARLFGIGFLLGLALITEYTTAVIVLPLAIYTLDAVIRKKGQPWKTAIAGPALGGLVPLAALLVYNTLCFGSPISMGYQHLQDPVFQAGMAEGLMGIGLPHLRVLYYLTLHPAMGLFWQSPVLLLALAGFFYLFREKRYRAEGLVAAFAFSAFLLLNAGYFVWWGGWSFGPRHLIPMLPFLCLPLARLPRKFTPLLALLGLVSIGQMIVVAASDLAVPDKIIQKIDRLGYFEYSTIYSYCLVQLQKGRFAWNLGQQLFHLQRWWSLAPLLLVMAAPTIWFLREKDDPPETIREST